MKKLLKNVSNDMVDLKRASGDNQGNHRGQAVEIEPSDRLILLTTIIN